MSNYCKNCHYSVSKKVGENSCPFNSLYWNFLDSKREKFKNNQRMRMMYSLLDKKDTREMDQIRDRASKIISDPTKF